MESAIKRDNFSYLWEVGGVVIIVETLLEGTGPLKNTCCRFFELGACQNTTCMEAVEK